MGMGLEECQGHQDRPCPRMRELYCMSCHIVEKLRNTVLIIGRIDLNIAPMSEFAELALPPLFVFAWLIFLYARPAIVITITTSTDIVILGKAGRFC